MTITTTDTTGIDAGIGSDIAGEPAAGIRIAQVPAPVAVDLYRDIHKGIRAELFDLVLLADGTDTQATREDPASDPNPHHDRAS